MKTISFKGTDEQIHNLLLLMAFGDNDLPKQEEPVEIVMALGSEAVKAIEDGDEVDVNTLGVTVKRTFQTIAEKNAYIQGMIDADGWMDFLELNEQQIKKYLS